MKQERPHWSAIGLALLLREAVFFSAIGLALLGREAAFSAYFEQAPHKCMCQWMKAT